MNELLESLKEKMKRKKTLKKHVDILEQLRKSPPAQSFLEECIQGQEELKTYLRTHEAKALIRISKEKGLRWASALGDVPAVNALLEEKIDPSTKDPEGRTALDYAGFRYEMVKLLWQNKEQARGLLLQEEKQTEEIQIGFKNHSQIFKNLMARSIFGKKTKTRVLELLKAERDSSEDFLTRSTVEECLREFENPEVK